MGCDAHVFTEVRHKGKWLLYSQSRPNRNYELFEKMAGVRGDVENALVPPKGFPEDASDMTRIIYEYEGEDAHTPSYYTLMEIMKLEKWYRANIEDGFMWHTDFGYLFGNGYEDMPNLENPPPIEDVRIVFWFDN